jgi:hypothetical protein
MAAEYERLAATIKTTLSGSLIAATFAIIAVQAALVVFVMDKREHLGVFTAVEITAAFLVILSAMLGANGIAEVYKTGRGGTWNIDLGKGFFSAQAIAVRRDGHRIMQFGGGSKAFVPYFRVKRAGLS